VEQDKNPAVEKVEVYIPSVSSYRLVIEGTLLPIWNGHWKRHGRFLPNSIMKQNEKQKLLLVPFSIIGNKTEESKVVYHVTLLSTKWYETKPLNDY
jgi:hypothetical protein